MDQLTYHYTPNSNRLRHVTDTRPAADYTVDIDTQPTNNYAYDPIGNLVKDSAEGISRIAWTVYGKIDSIYKTGTTISFTYDAGGNRISKKVNNTETWYIRDAQGNVLSTYTYSDSQLLQDELHLYGSSRLGLHRYNLNVNTMPAEPVKYVGDIVGIKRSFVRGNKFFELSNHLGNVLAVVNDRKIPVPNSANPMLVGRYKPVVVSASDYYVFGMQIPGRGYESGAYRYGFNGKENDNEVKGAGNQQDYGMRIYDPRVGRWLSTDPLQSKYPNLSPYNFVANSPLNAIDPDGRLIIFINGLWGPPNQVGEGGAPSYWGTRWVAAAQEAIGDYKTPMFIDGALGGTTAIPGNLRANDRVQIGGNIGYLYGKTIIGSLDEGETIKNHYQ